MKILYYLLLINLLTFTANIGYVYYKYLPYFDTYLNGESIWNKKYDRTRLVLNVFFLSTPLLLFSIIKNYNSSNLTLNISFLILLLLFSISIFFVLNDFVWDKTYEKNSCNKEIEKKINKKSMEIQNSSIKYQFNKLIVDLEKFDFYNKEKRVFILNTYGISHLQSLQYLLVFFKKHYLDPNIDNTKIYHIFNDYFNIGERKMTTQNWNRFKKKRLLDIDENDFFYDLSSIINKYHFTTNKTNKTN